MSRSPLIADDQQLDLCELLETAGATHDHEARDPSAIPHHVAAHVGGLPQFVRCAASAARGGRA